MSTTLSHLSRWIPFSKSTVRDRAASARPLMESLEPRLLLDGSVAIETYVHVEPGPLVGEMVSIDPADSGILQAFVGDTIVWTYEVTNDGDVPLSDIIVVDDNGTSDNDDDDFIPAQVLDPEGLHNVGDTGNYDVLDVDEEWLYTARSLVFDEVPYKNVASVTASFEEVVSGGGDAGFTEYAVLADGNVIIGAFFSVDGGFLGSNCADDAFSGVFAASNLKASMGVRGAGNFGDGGWSMIGTEGSAIEDAIVFNGSAMVSPGSTVYGNIRIGGAGIMPTIIAGAHVYGDIYTGGDEFSVIISDAVLQDPISGEDIFYEAMHDGVIHTDADPQPFEAPDFTSLYEFIPGLDDTWVTHPDPDGSSEPLELGPGNHYFASLTLGDNATLQLNPSAGPIVIHVAGNMVVGADFEMVFVDEVGTILDEGAADQVYVQTGNLTVGKDATWSGTVYSPDGNFYFGSNFNLTGAVYGGGLVTFSSNTAAGEGEPQPYSVITYEELDFEALGIDVSGGGGGETETSEVGASCSAQYEGVLPTIDISSLSQKAEALLVQYTGDTPVYIVAASRANIDDPKAQIYFDGVVEPGETFAIDALTAGKSKLKGETYVQIFDAEGNLLETVQIHSSMSESLVLGDHFGDIRLVGFIGDEGARAGIVPVEMLTGLSGFVFEDFNGDGMVDQDEYAITGATVTLTRFDYKGDVISSIPTTTDSDGAYYFDALQPGNYTITETQPVGYNDGADTVGTAGGLLGSDAISEIVLGAYVEGVNYNFGEHNAGTPGEGIALGQTATIGFWAGKKGKKLIESLNGDENSTALGDWLAEKFNNIYSDLSGKTNTDVANFYGKLFKAAKKRGRHGGGDQIDLRDLNAQVMATALAVYVTDSRNFAGGAAAEYGFIISDGGVGVATFDVGDNGAAFGVDNGTVMTILEILQATNAQAIEGSLYDINVTLRELADKVYTMINELGGIE